MPVIYTLSLCARLTLDLHDLNNETTEGNQQMTRTVWVVVKDQNGKPTLANVNAISGDMFKHIQAEHLHKIAIDQNRQEPTSFPLSEGARLFDANRINLREDIVRLVNETLKRPGLANSEKKGLTAVLAKLKTSGDAPEENEDNAEEASGDETKSGGEKKSKGTVPYHLLVDQLLSMCGVTDLMGILITAGKLSLPRKSCIEFGWVVGIPDLTKTESLFHVKFDPRGRAEGAGSEENRGQAIFYRPVNSGIYAVVSHVELYRIGRNDITQHYSIDEESRKTRAKALLESLWYTFVKTSGAQRNTQHPHVTGLEGVLAYSTKLSVPSPTASPLEERFQEELEGTANALNQLRQDAITIKRFKNQTEFGAVMAELVKSVEVPLQN